MEIRNKMRMLLTGVALAGALFVGRPNAQAQPPGGMPPGMMEKIKAWQKWQEQHKKLTLLGDQVFQIEKMNEEPSYALSKGQAAKMLQILNPWRSRTAMSEDQATSIYKQVGNVLTTKQIKKMTQIEPPSVTMKKRGMGGMGGGARPGAGSPPPGGAGFKFPDPPKSGWNPFNAATFPFEQARPAMQKRTNDFFASLQHRANS